MNTASDSPPLVLAGPILRRVEAQRLVLWMVTSRDTTFSLALYRDDDGDKAEADDYLDLATMTRRVALGTQCWLQLIDIDFGACGLAPLPEGRPIGYDLWIEEENLSLASLEPALCYAGERRPRFVVKKRLDSVLHGSCRRPHNPSGDGMARVDRWLAERRNRVDQWPALMLLTGDQIYADDVAGPLLRAIHAFIERVGLWPETLRGATVDDSAELYASPECYYRRNRLLPEEKSNRALQDYFFGGTRKPVFTSDCAGNHLITLAEILGMYLMCWSDAPWRDLTWSRPELDEEECERYEEETGIIDDFVAELPAVRRLLANMPTAMIFDDHDVTDDWNLTALWMDSAYDHPFSRRIIGNALLGYLLCQGLGNGPEAFDDDVWPGVVAYTQRRDAASQDALIDTLLDFRGWAFVIDTEPRIVVLDTRTRRWRRERQPAQPSGLMDWEALTELQENLMGRDSVVMVSAAPIFGVKLIENIQRLFSWFGYPLMVDAENWMAHRGSARTLLNIFCHRDTPKNFTVLSGDVHYSFVYDVRLRLSRTRQRIWQITSSGVKNEFPRRLLDWFDRLNRWLYAPYSPLNWFTKRRRLRISPRRPSPRDHGERLVNGSGMGLVRFNPAGQPVEITALRADEPDVIFDRGPDAEIGVESD